MQTTPQTQTRREFLGSLKPGWLRRKMILAIVYAAAVVFLIYVSVSTIRELGFANTIKTAAGFFGLLALAYLGSRAADVAHGLFMRCPKVVKALLRTFGRLLICLIFGFCGIYVYEQWKAKGDIRQMLVALLIFFALQFRDELRKQD